MIELQKRNKTAAHKFEIKTLFYNLSKLETKLEKLIHCTNVETDKKHLTDIKDSIENCVLS